MNAAMEFLAEAARRLAAVSWQVAVLVVLVLAAQRLLARWLTPRFRYGLWWLVVARLLLPVLPASDLSVYRLFPAEPEAAAVTATAPPAAIPGTRKDAPPADTAPTRAASTGPAVSAPGSASSVDGWSIAGLAWLAGVAAIGLVTLLREGRFLARLRRAPEIATPWVRRLVEDCRSRVGVRRRVTAVSSAELGVPATAGILRPRVILPATALEKLSRAELELVVLHEMEHVRRHDAAANWLLHALRCAFWFHPFVRLAFARLSEEREIVRDLAALRRQSAATGRDYGRTILKLLDPAVRTRRPASLVAVLGRHRDLKRRITMIARFADRPRRGLVLGVSIVLVLAVATLTVPAPAADEPAPAAPPPPEGDAAPPADGLKKIRVERQEQAPAWRKAMEEKLAAQRVSFEFQDATLAEALDYLREVGKLNIVLSEDSRYEAENAPITLSVKDLCLSSALDLLTRLADFEYALAEDAVVLAQKGELPPPMDQRMYNLKPLLAGTPADDRESELEHLAGLVQEFVLPDSWDNYGATIRFWGDLLVVRQTDDGHRRVEFLLNGLLNRGRGTVPPEPAWRATLDRALDKKIDVNFEETPLTATVAFLSRATGVNMIIGPDVAEEWGDPDVSLRLQKASARAVLRTLARQVGASAVLKEGVVFLTTTRSFTTRMYDVADLVPSHPSEDSDGEQRSPDDLLELVSESVDPDSWGEWEEAKMGFWQGLLVVSQSEEVHGEIETFFAALRRAMK